MIYMGLGFYNIPNQFSDMPFDSCIEVDVSVEEQFDASTEVLCWDGTKLIPLVIPTEEGTV